MRCKYCGAEMRLDDKAVNYFIGSVFIVDRNWCCNDCGSFAYEQLVGGKSVILYFYLPEEEFRCCICVGRLDCPACGSGVCYPCPYFKER